MGGIEQIDVEAGVARPMTLAKTAMDPCLAFSVPGSARRCDAEECAFEATTGRLRMLFQALNCRISELPRPEIYPTVCDRVALFGAKRPIHIIHRPVREIRLLKGAYNIGWLAWNEPFVQDRVVHHDPFSNTARMLELLDELWVGSQAAVELLTFSGLRSVRLIPLPLATFESETCEDTMTSVSGLLFDGDADWRGRLQGAAEGLSLGSAGASFLSIVDAEHWRSDPETIVDAFLDLDAAIRVDLILVCITDAVFKKTSRYLSDRLSSVSGAPRRIYVVPRLTDQQQHAMFGRAAFFLCTSRFEGQNLSLLDAMAQGVVPITVGHTAMRDYIDDNDAVVIATLRKRIGTIGTGDNTCRLEHATRSACLAAMTQALRLDPLRRAAISRSAQEVSRRSFAMSAVAASVATRLAHIRDGLTHA